MEKRIHGFLFVFFFVTYGYFFQGGGWNRNVRFDHLRSMVEEGRLDLGAAPLNTDDYSIYRGKYFSTKAPGPAFLAVPVYAVLYNAQVLAGKHPWESDAALHRDAYLVTLCTVSFFSALFMVIFYETLGCLAPVNSTFRLLVTLAYGLGTLAFPWSTLLHPHQLSAICLFGAFSIFLSEEYAKSGEVRCCPFPGRLSDCSAGLLLGLAVQMEYQNVVPVALLLAYRLGGPARRQGILSVLKGLLLPLGLLLAYHWLCYGSPLATGYQYQHGRFVTAGQSNFGLPSLRTFLELTVFPHRGVFYTSPVLLLTIPGMFYFFQRRHGRQAEGLVCLGVVVFYLLLNCSYRLYDGGWTIGPRFLIPCFPFLAVSLAFLGPRWKPILAAVLLLSVSVELAITAVNPCPAMKIRNPLFNHTLSHLLKNQVSVNTQGLMDKWPPEEIGLPLSERDQWHAWNAGELLGLEGILSLTPLLFFWLVAGVILYRMSREKRMQAP